MPDQTDYKTMLGFDFGLKQIGVAYGQSVTGSCKPLSIIKAADGVPNWQHIESLIDEWQPDFLIVGLPLNMDGSESDLSILATKFARRLQGRFNLAVVMVDERLTSREVKDSLKAQTIDSGRRQKSIAPSKIDHLAAALIVQSWLDNPELGHPLK